MGILMNIANGDGSTTAFTLPNNADYPGPRVLVGDGVTTQVGIAIYPQGNIILKNVAGTISTMVRTTEYTISGNTLTFVTAPAVGTTIHNMVVPTFYKRDWAGDNLLYSTSRTNLLPYGDAMTGAGWSFATGGTGVGGGTATGGQTGPDGTASAVRLQMTIGAGATGSDFVQYWHNALVLDGVSTYTDSFWIKSNTASNYNIQWTDPANANKALTVTTSWTRVSGSAIGNASSRIRWFIQGNLAVDKTVDILVAKVQTELGSSATPFIPTPGAASGSVTDYSFAAPVVTLSPALPIGSVLAWDGSTLDRN